ncbi:distal tail protein Dit [Bacillus cereus]|uniref:distal tail protein Dit n=1 Tax=Bacillus cereus TaxID=1396 RepID=UPI0024BD2F3E|nr:distal tail protein Dit [Bacillus cereus]
MSTFKFNGQTREYMYTLMGFNRDVWAPITRNILQVKGLAGGHLLNKDVGIRKIEVPVQIKSKDQADMQKIKEDIARWLITEEPAELIFADEIDRTYMAVVDGSLNFNELVQRGKGTITFLCPMPFKLGAEKKFDFAISSAQDLKVSFTNDGTERSPAVIDLVVGKKSPFLDVWQGNKYFRLGYPAGITTQIVAKEERVIWDEMASLTGWTPHTKKLAYQMPTGTMKIWQNYAFYTDTYGTDSAWHGPIMTKPIPNSDAITDFILDCQMTLNSNNIGQLGAVAVFLLTDNDEVMAMMDLTDYFSDASMLNARIDVGFGEAIAGNPNNNRLIESTGNIREGSFTDFRGHLTIKREGQMWTAKVSKYHYKTEIDNDTVIATWIDKDNTSKFTKAKPRKIAVGISAYNTSTPMQTAFIEDVKFYKINHIEKDTTPYIFDVGDKIRINTETSLVTINGQDAISIKDIFSRFPYVEGGANELIIRPKDVGMASLTYKERYK